MLLLFICAQTANKAKSKKGGKSIAVGKSARRMDLDQYDDYLGDEFDDFM